MHCFFVYFFFFSSRRRHTRLVSDWSSDVCSSDLSMSKSQRDFFLREQIRAIQRELGEADPTTTEINALREQIEEIDQIGRASCREKSVDLGGRRIIKKKKK